MFMVHLLYIGEEILAQLFMKEMMEFGLVDHIRQQEGNISYAYYIPVDDPHSILLG